MQTKSYYFLPTCILLLSAMFLLIAGLSGCAPAEESPPPEPAEEKEVENEEEIVEETRKVMLYFGDTQAENLITEEREIEPGEEGLMVAVLEELIRGPEDPDLVRTVPEETRVIGVDVQDGVAEIDFSEEIRSEHWGGSTGERMTVMSVTNTLAAGFEEVDQVKFLIEGEEIETLTGHLDLSQPVGPEL